MKLINADSSSESNKEYIEKAKELYMLLKEIDPRKAFLSLIRNDELKEIVE